MKIADTLQESTEEERVLRKVLEEATARMADIGLGIDETAISHLLISQGLYRLSADALCSHCLLQELTMVREFVEEIIAMTRKEIVGETEEPTCTLH